MTVRAAFSKDYAKTLRKNAAYQALDPAARRKAVVAEAFVLHARGEIACDRWGYVFHKEGDDLFTVNETPEGVPVPVPLEKELLQGQTCHVCADGGLFVAAITKFPGFLTTQFMHEPSPAAYRSPSRLGATEVGSLLREIFTIEQVALIEAAYEQRTDQNMVTYVPPRSRVKMQEDLETAAQWGEEAYSYIRRIRRPPYDPDGEGIQGYMFRAILNNMWAHDGLFDPRDGKFNIEIPEELRQAVEEGS